jgi:hypothetical protein
MIESPARSEFFSKWIRICLLNLLIVALLGATMRYKIAFSLPWLPQKNILNAHSHFAFAGWLTQILMTMLVRYLACHMPAINLPKYRALLWANLLTAVGMLLSFPWEGYGTVSIIFSTLSILVSYVFAWIYWRDLSRLPERFISHYWFKAAVLWNAIASLGPFFLAYMMANRIMHEHWYLGSIYYFLHFQYNGWFFFACAGLLLGSNYSRTKQERTTFWLMTLACFPAYMLSILWAHLPSGAYTLTAVATLAQTIAWVMLMTEALKGRIALLQSMRPTVRVLMIFAAIAGSTKFLLQAGSLHPGLAKLAFGFRPIVIGYLHLVLLGLITIYLLAYLKRLDLIAPGGARKQGLVVFIGGIILQEVLLFLQGTLAISYNTIPYVNEMLFFSALVMLSGILMLNIGVSRQPHVAVGEAG